MFSGTPAGILVNAPILLGHLVDVLFSGRSSNLFHDSAPNLDEVIRVRLIVDRQGNLRVPPRILLLHSPNRCVDKDEFSIRVHPNWCDLGSSIPVNSGNVKEVLTFQ